MIYPEVGNHPALAGQSKALKAKDPAAFDAQVLQAEVLLGLDATTPYMAGTRSRSVASLAVALQVNWQIEYGTAPYVYSSENNRVQQESRSYRDPLAAVNPQAQSLLQGLWKEDGAWATVRSVRGPQS